jgi:hypothetical protein
VAASGETSSGIKFQPFKADLIAPPGGIPFQKGNIPAVESLDPETPALGEIPEVVTEERVMGLCRLALETIPEGFGKPWLATPEEQLKPFVKELTIYFNAHDIDPSEWIGDWFPLVITGLPIGFGIVHRYKEHKKENTTAEKEIRSGTREVEAPKEPEPEESETDEETT